MSDSFQMLEEQKKDRIINAALKEFCSMGFDKASTNAIVGRAAISKGSLFNYFENKKHLFLYLFEYFEKLSEEYLLNSVDWANTDLLFRVEALMLKMTEFLETYPDAMEFIRKAKFDGSEIIHDEVMKIKKSSTEKLMEKLLDDADYSSFKEDLDIEKLLFTIQSTIQNVLHDALKKEVFDSEETGRKISEYIKFFRLNFTRKEQGE